MFGQRYQPIHPINVFIAALNEEEGVGATISESENVNVNRILLIDGYSHDRTLMHKDVVQKSFSKMVKVKAMRWPRLCSVWVPMLSTWLSLMRTLLIQPNVCLK
jgi:hypothetical protein